MEHAVVMLAAGAGSRFRADGHKLLAALRSDGRPVLAHSLDAAILADIGPVVLVTGAVDPLTDPTVADLVERHDVRVHANPQWAAGQSTSLAVGIGAAKALGVEAVCVGLGDQPFVVSDAWRQVAASPSSIAVATYDGVRGNPVRLHRSVWPLLPTDGDRGARVLMGSRPDLVTEVPCTGSPADIDTLEDLRRWQSN